MRWVDELLSDVAPRWACDMVEEALDAKDVEIVRQYDEITSLRAEIERLLADNLLWQDRCLQFQTERDELRAKVEALRAALLPLAKIPVEAFGKANVPDHPLMGWNGHVIYVRDVLAAREGK